MKVAIVHDRLTGERGCGLSPRGYGSPHPYAGITAKAGRPSRAGGQLREDKKELGRQPHYANLKSILDMAWR